ncbi:general odorant-binding protein 45-like [Ochlerotatus camptorhynchus]|uniref:general odorant-binding protein 45-like n=1 Tax=Ochlerotatus camptorhynchus TaxID=644619 RepID=UPI0031E412AA
MKGLRISIVIALVALASGVIEAGQHDAVLKSFSTSGGECGQYLNNDGNGECNVHCIGIVNHNWNDMQASFTRNYAYFFTPDADDKCYQNRTDRCLDQVYSSIPIYNKCLRAQQAGQCYNDQYGQLNASLPHYVPMTDLQYTRVMRQCAYILGLSDYQLSTIVEQGAYNASDGACLLRCTVMRMGLWHDKKGIDLARATMQCGIYGDKTAILDCQAKIMAEECDKCIQVKRTAQECLKMHYKVNKNQDGHYSVELYGTFIEIDTYSGSSVNSNADTYQELSLQVVSFG